MKLNPHKGSCELPQLREYCAARKRPIAVDLFCGAGGLSLGLEQAGFDVVLGADIDADSAATHRHHFPGVSLKADLSDPETVAAIVDALKGIDVSLVAGGPPCQPFSKAGSSKIRELLQKGIWESDERRELWQAFVDVVEGLRPRAVLVENVSEMALGHNAEVLRRLVDALEGLGYAVHTKILAAWQHGVPQHRRRLFVVALRERRRFRWPTGIPKEGGFTVMDAIGDLPELNHGEGEPEQAYSGVALTALQKELRKGMRKKVVFDHIARQAREDDLEAYKILNHRTRYDELPPNLRRYRSDIFLDKYNRLDGNAPSRSITAHLSKDGYWYIHPEQDRTLTVREAARIQTFPDGFRFFGSHTSAFRQIGEAVPPLLGRVLGKEIIRTLRRKHHGSWTLSTRDLSGRLSEWISNEAPRHLSAPWRSSGSLWHCLLGMLVLKKLPRRILQDIWDDLVHELPSAGDYLKDSRGDRALRALGIHPPLRKEVSALAAALAAQEEAKLDPARIPNLTRAQVIQAKAMSGVTHQLLDTAATARVAARVLDESHENSKMSKQLHLARLVGTSWDGSALRGLMEVADRFCTPSLPRCGECPLLQPCRSADPRSAEDLRFHPDF